MKPSTQFALPLQISELELELREKCPLVEVRTSRETINKFDWKVIEGTRDGAVVVRSMKQFWSQAKNEFLDQYQVLKDSVETI